MTETQKNHIQEVIEKAKREEEERAAQDKKEAEAEAVAEAEPQRTHRLFLDPNDRLHR